MGNSNVVDIHVRIKRETEKAICVNDGGAKDVWIPKAYCDTNALAQGDTGEITVEEWIAKEKGLI